MSEWRKAWLASLMTTGLVTLLLAWRAWPILKDIIVGGIAVAFIWSAAYCLLTINGETDGVDPR